jgi:hypothetical protein
MYWLSDPPKAKLVVARGALVAGGSLVAAGAVGTVWEADVTLGAGFGLGLAICYTPAVAAVQPWFDRNRGVASGIALSGTGLGTLLMPLIARWLIEDEGWRIALIVIGLGVAGFGFLASNWIRRPPGLPPTSSSQRSSSSLRKLVRDPSFQWLYLGGFLSSLVLLVPIVHLIPHAIRAGVAPRDAAWLISILGFGSLAGRLVLGHAADRLGRQRILGVLHLALGILFLTWTIKAGFVTLAVFCVRLRRLLRRNHRAAAGGNRRPFPRPEFGCGDRPALHELRARPAHRSRGVRLLGRLLEQRLDCKLRGCSLPGRCRVFLRSKTASNSTAPDEHLPASIEPNEDAGLYQFLERPAFGDARRLTAAERLLSGRRPDDGAHRATRAGDPSGPGGNQLRNTQAQNRRQIDSAESRRGKQIGRRQAGRLDCG